MRAKRPITNHRSVNRRQRRVFVCILLLAGMGSYSGARYFLWASYQHAVHQLRKPLQTALCACGLVTTSAFQPNCQARIAELLKRSHACAGVLIGPQATSVHTHQQQIEGLEESPAAQHTLAQLGFRDSVRRLLGGGARDLAAADEEEDESYDDDLDIDEPLTAGQAPLPGSPNTLPACEKHNFKSVPQPVLQVRNLKRALKLAWTSMRQ